MKVEGGTTVEGGREEDSRRAGQVRRREERETAPLFILVRLLILSVSCHLLLLSLRRLRRLHLLCVALRLSVVLLSGVEVLRLADVAELLLLLLQVWLLLLMLPLSVMLLRLGDVVMLRVSSLLHLLLLRRSVVRLGLDRHFLAGDQVAVHRAARGNGGANLVKAENDAHR